MHRTRVGIAALILATVSCTSPDVVVTSSGQPYVVLEEGVSTPSIPGDYVEIREIVATPKGVIVAERARRLRLSSDAPERWVDDLVEGMRIGERRRVEVDRDRLDLPVDAIPVDVPTPLVYEVDLVEIRGLDRVMQWF